VDTVGGYLCLQAGHVPAKGEEFAVDGWLFVVDEADMKQILRVSAAMPSEPAAAGD
jgi:magnesium and cobalt transporter